MAKRFHEITDRSQGTTRAYNGAFVVTEVPPTARSNLYKLGLTALGVVFGDIGTSPLYTLKTVLSLSGDAPARDAVLGVLSLLIWTLVVVTTIKYVNVAMRVDNDGEGGSSH